MLPAFVAKGYFGGGGSAGSAEVKWRCHGYKAVGLH